MQATTEPADASGSLRRRILLALAIALVSVLASATYGTLKGLEAFRAVKRLGGTAGAIVEDVTPGSPAARAAHA